MYITPGLIIVFCVDIIRQIHLGTGNYISGFLCEIGNFIVTIFTCWFVGFKLDYKYIGILWSISIGQGIGFIIYFLNFTFNKNFKEIQSVASFKNICKKKKIKKS